MELSAADSKDASGVKYTSYDIPAEVSAEGKTYTVTSVGESVFRWSSAESITIPETVERIGAQAFSSTDKLTGITLPARLSYIGDAAFSSSGLTSITIPASVKEIGNNAFFTCKSLESITFNEGLEKIGTSAFYKTPLKNVVLPMSLTVLGDKAFLYCNLLASVTLPSGLTALGAGTFYGCTSLASIDIPAGVTSIGDECFLECTALESVTIPAAVGKIGTSIIAKSGVTTISVDAANEKFHVVDGTLYSSDNTILYAIPMKGVTVFKVDDKCIGINGGAFWGSEVSKVTLPDGLLAIDDYAFCQSALAEINFPGSLTFIGEQGFASTQLAEVTLPENMPYIYDGAFAGCGKMTSLTIPSGVRMVYNHAFHNNKALSSVTSLGADAPEIDEVYEEYDSPFYGISSSTPLYVPKGCAASYKEAGWDRYFTITETDKGVLAVVATSPESGSRLSKYAEMKAEIVFGEDITIVQDKPAVYLREGSELSGTVIKPEDTWHAVKGGDSKTLRVWASDYDSYTMTFSPKQDTKYYFIIPAGVVMNAAGELNGKIVIELDGPAAPKPLTVVSTTPADGAVLPVGRTEMAFNITFDSDITILDYGPDATLRKADKDNGTKITPDLSWKSVKGDDDKTLRIWASDYDYMVQQFKVEEGVTYYMVIPAGIVKNADDARNEEIVIEFSGPSASAISGIGNDNGVSETARYSIGGQRLSSRQKGVNIIRMSDGSTVKVYVK